MDSRADAAIIGAGAAGLATAIFAARANPRMRVLLIDGSPRPGAKILVSGGGRCNVTNVTVRPEDFRGGSRNAIRRVLAAFTVPEAIAFFAELGVTLHEEEHGKLFPDSNSARTVLAALLDEIRRLGVHTAFGQRVTHIERTDDGFAIDTPQTTWHAAQLVLATGGLSLPKTGSDGSGYGLAQSLGHTLVPTTPALAPLLLDGDFHAPLSGIAQDVELTVRVAGQKPVRLAGAMLWTHFGISGPVVLNASGLWHRARLEGLEVSVTANLLPREDFQRAEQWLLSAAAARPRSSLATALAERLPARVADAVLRTLGIAAHVPLAHLSRDDRRRLVTALLDWPLPVRDSRGYKYAEVTAGGVPLGEVDPRTMASRVCPGLCLVGEILDVDGRIGGFNFQWAWSSAKVAGAAIARHAEGATNANPDVSARARPS